MNIETEEKLLFLKKIPLLGCLPNETLADPRYCAIKKYAKGETIFSEGSKNNYLYILLEGLIKLMVFPENGNARIAHFVTKGDFFGDISAQLEKVSAVAQSPAEVAAIPKMQFKRFLHNHEFAAHFIAMLYHQNNLYQERVLLKSIKSAKERLTTANKILSEITRDGKFDLTYQEIGEFCFFTRETAGRGGKVLTFKNCLTMKERRERHKKIVSEFLDGAEVEKLAEIHGLGVQCIRHVIRRAMEEESKEIRFMAYQRLRRNLNLKKKIFAKIEKNNVIQRR